MMHTTHTTAAAVEIEPIEFQRRFVLAHGVHRSQTGLVGSAYWSHSLGLWVHEAQDATAFDTQAGALVYRRGNLLRMQIGGQQQ